MRKFAFVVFDYDNSVSARFAVDYITDISGLGWKLKLSTLKGDIVDTITKVVQEKQDVSLTVNFIGRGYEKYSILSQWLQKYSTADQRIALEYDDGIQVRYVEGKAIELKKSEKNEYNNLACALKFTPTTPFFKNIEQNILIKTSSVGKSYPFKYPYAYGLSRMVNNTIDNPYIASVPVTVKITGSIYSPTIRLLDETGTEYSRVAFCPNRPITLHEGEYIIINSASKKIYYFNGETLSDFSAETDPRYDTYLLAKSGISRVGVNLKTSDTGELTGSWRQYSL